MTAMLIALLASGTLLAQEVSSSFPPSPPRGVPEITPHLHHDGLENVQRQLSRREVRQLAMLRQPSSESPGQTDEFKPISELPPDEKLPAAPMLVAAYIFVLLAFFAYVLSLARRMRSVTAEMARLEAELKRTAPR